MEGKGNSKARYKLCEGEVGNWGLLIKKGDKYRRREEGKVTVRYLKCDKNHTSKDLYIMLVSQNINIHTQFK